MHAHWEAFMHVQEGSGYGCPTDHIGTHQNFQSSAS